MADKAQSPDAAASEETPVTPAAVAPPRRSPGHRGADVRDTMAEMAARAHEISQEAGSKMAAAMKDVINAAAGLAGFAVESARDLVQYMVRRGQMTQEEADKLLRDAEQAYAKRKPAPAPVAAAASSSNNGDTAVRNEPVRADSARHEPPRAASPKAESAGPRRAEPAARESASPAAAAPAKKSATRPAAKAPVTKAPARSATKAVAKPPAKAASKAPAKAAAKKGAPAKGAAKSAPSAKREGKATAKRK